MRKKNLRDTLPELNPPRHPPCVIWLHGEPVTQCRDPVLFECPLNDITQTGR